MHQDSRQHGHPCRKPGGGILRLLHWVAAVAWVVAGCDGGGTRPVETALAVAPARIALGPVALGQAAEGEVQLRNLGRVPLQVQLEAQPPFSVPSSVRLETGASVPVTVRFAPDEEGEATGVLRLTAAGKTAEVSLSGKATGCPASTSACSTVRFDVASRHCVEEAAPEGTSCELACAARASCRAGTCVAEEALSCEDGNVCTEDVCQVREGQGVCASTDVSRRCPPPAHSCQRTVCDATQGCGYVTEEDGTPCTHPCLAQAGQCQAGVCQGTLGSGSAACPSLEPPRIGVSYVHSCALTAQGGVRCWGDNSSGELGDGSRTNRLLPVAVQGLSGVVGVALGSVHTCALKEDGTVWCWGSNSDGELGLGTFETGQSYQSGNVTVHYLSRARQVPGLTGVKAVAAGTYSTCALKADGTVWCWGRGVVGTTLSPCQVQGVSGAVGVSVGHRHACALVADGTVRCWGDNDSGQMGAGWPPQEPATSPVPLEAPEGLLTGVVEIAAWSQTTWLRFKDGSARSVMFSWIPGNYYLAVSALGDVAHLDTGEGSMCTLRSDGDVRCWGMVVGDGTDIIRDEPTAPIGLGKARGLALGHGYTCALLEDWSHRCWGDNSNGQLGDGTNDTRWAP